MYLFCSLMRSFLMPGATLTGEYFNQIIRGAGATLFKFLKLRRKNENADRVGGNKIQVA
jgi:hypothetical protein